MIFCHDCDEPATGVWYEPTGPDTVRTIPVCYPCWYARDNYEPPDPVGDPAGPRCDAMHRMEEARRLKR